MSLVTNIPFPHKFIQDWMEDDIWKVVYTSRQLNTIPEKTLAYYNVVLIGNMSMLECMKAAQLNCYDSVTFPDLGNIVRLSNLIISMLW